MVWQARLRDVVKESDQQKSDAEMGVSLLERLEADKAAAAANVAAAQLGNGGPGVDAAGEL